MYRPKLYHQLCVPKLFQSPAAAVSPVVVRGWVVVLLWRRCGPQPAPSSVGGEAAREADLRRHAPRSRGRAAEKHGVRTPAIVCCYDRHNNMGKLLSTYNTKTPRYLQRSEGRGELTQRCYVTVLDRRGDIVRDFLLYRGVRYTTEC